MPVRLEKVDDIHIRKKFPVIVTSKINDRGKEKTLEGENYNIYS